MEQIEQPFLMTDLVADEIRKAILEGEIPIGSKISVAQICSELNVSATPVKAALKMLQVEGLLVTKPRSGTYISDFAKSNMENTAYIRSALEGSAAYIATKEANDEELEHLEQILQEADAAFEKNDVEALVTLNTAFHKGLRMASHNSYLIMLIEQMVSFDFTFRKSALSTLDERKIGMTEHHEVLRQMKARNPEGAESALLKHIRRSAHEVVTNTEKKDKK